MGTGRSARSTSWIDTTQLCKALSYELAALARMTPIEVTLPGSPDHAFPLLSKPTVPPGRVIGQTEFDAISDVAMQEPGRFPWNQPLSPNREGFPSDPPVNSAKSNRCKVVACSRPKATVCRYIW